jgi:hypothetical protein
MESLTLVMVSSRMEDIWFVMMLHKLLQTGTVLYREIKRVVE